MIKLEIDEKFEELSNLYDLFENITRIDYVPLEYREEIKQSLIKAYKDGNQEFEKIHEKLKRLEVVEKENQELLIALENKNNEIKQLKTLINDNKLIKVIKDKIEYLEKGVFLAPNYYIKGGIQALKDLLKEALIND